MFAAIPQPKTPKTEAPPRKVHQPSSPPQDQSNADQKSNPSQHTNNLPNIDPMTKGTGDTIHAVEGLSPEMLDRGGIDQSPGLGEHYPGVGEDSDSHGKFGMFNLFGNAAEVAKPPLARFWWSQILLVLFWILNTI